MKRRRWEYERAGLAPSAAQCVWLTCVLCLVGWIAAGPVWSATASLPDPRSMTFSPVTFAPPDAERLELDNGLVVYLLEDHELPLVHLGAMMRVGAWLDPLDKTGLAEVTGQLMRDGGSAMMPAKDIDEALEHIAASVSFGIGDESGTASLDVLKKDLSTGIRIFADLLRSPAFETDRLELLRLQALEAIRRRQDHPGAIASREFTKLIYGPDHPYARESTVETVKRITRDDVVAFHRTHIHPNGIIMGVSGDFDKKALIQLIRDTFGDWQRGEVSTFVAPPVPADDAGNAKLAVRFVGKETSQAHLRVGELTIKETDPDYPALAILNDILGEVAFGAVCLRTSGPIAGWRTRWEAGCKPTSVSEDSGRCGPKPSWPRQRRWSADSSPMSSRCVPSRSPTLNSPRPRTLLSTRSCFRLRIHRVLSAG